MSASSPTSGLATPRAGKPSPRPPPGWGRTPPWRGSSCPRRSASRVRTWWCSSTGSPPAAGWRWSAPTPSRPSRTSNPKAPSAGRAGFEFEDHFPDAVHLPALDQLEGLEAPEGGVGLFQPSAEVAGVHHPGEAQVEALHLDEALAGRLGEGLAGLPIGQGPLR